MSNGSLQGVDLGGMLKNTASSFSGGGGATSVQHASASFTIRNGTMTTRDLAVSTSSVDATGGGTVNLPPRTFNFRIEPKLIAGLVTVPVMVSGPWDHLSYRARSRRHRQGHRADAGQGHRRRRERRRQDRSRLVGCALNSLFGNRCAAPLRPIDARRKRSPTGDRAALARAITLVESTRADDRDDAEKMLARLLPRAGGAIRLGISGAPGVGKSTFIEAFGLMLIEEGHRVAVLAVDPSSKRAGGSILGDKTRMPRLSQSDAAFIRPSPAGKSLGGVARRTRDAMLLAAAAGFDIVIVETVGVGQSETAVADMVDLFLLLIAPGGGDDLQGIKKGIVELADLVVVNKDDGDLAPAAKRAVADYRHALRLLMPADGADAVDALAVSALEGSGLDKVWALASDAARRGARAAARSTSGARARPRRRCGARSATG